MFAIHSSGEVSWNNITKKYTQLLFFYPVIAKTVVWGKVVKEPINSNILVILMIGLKTASKLDKNEQFCTLNTPKEILSQFLCISHPVEKILCSI